MKDSTTKIVCVEDLKKTNGGLYLLAVALECPISGGIICLFNVFNSRIIRAIHVKEKVYILILMFFSIVLSTYMISILVIVWLQDIFDILKLNFSFF